MQPSALSYVSHLDFLRFVRRLHVTIGPAVLNATFLYLKMSRIRRRFHGTIGPAVLKSTFFVPPGCQNSIPGNILIVAEVLAPCLPCSSLPAAPVHPCLFPSLLASARPPDSGPADRCESSGAFFHSARKAGLGNSGWPRAHPWWSPLPSPCHRHQTPSLHPSIPPALHPSTLSIPPPFHTSIPVPHPPHTGCLEGFHGVS